jgi:mono/diheme cytochrome c family protein
MGRLASIALLAALAAPAAGPVIRFEHTTHDFGSIPAAGKQTYAWPYRNEGTEPLEIVAMHPSCGCTASVADPVTVPPGGAGTLKVTFDPEGQTGTIRKTLAVVTNDTAHPRTILTILASIQPAKEQTMPGGHPPFNGQSLLMGSCATCHAEPAKGKSGEALWQAVCAMCHAKASADLTAFLASHDDAALIQSITYGTANPKMPGFSDLMGGPLDEAQIRSLAAAMRAHPKPPAAK